LTKGKKVLLEEKSIKKEFSLEKFAKEKDFLFENSKNLAKEQSKFPFENSKIAR